MFDPTAYENLKVVLQGAMYELELLGSLKVIGREDIVDLATLARKYSLTVCNPDKQKISVTVILSAGLEEWNAEMTSFGGKAGAMLEVCYQSHGSYFTKGFMNSLKEWWGPGRNLEWREITSSNQPFLHQAVVNFNRIITEEMVDDLEEVVAHIENSLMELIFE